MKCTQMEIRRSSEFTNLTICLVNQPGGSSEHCPSPISIMSNEPLRIQQGVVCRGTWVFAWSSEGIQCIARSSLEEISPAVKGVNYRVAGCPALHGQITYLIGQSPSIQNT
jgi:hypothetical protein